ncbi:putative phage head-tail adaptor [Clostridiales bacterium oral taxon 876 str. F0540]|nr:putative phage head-tail adaptor [Clostridiales bacterium oral taxon 876 str. F0540]
MSLKKKQSTLDKIIITTLGTYTWIIIFYLLLGITFWSIIISTPFLMSKYIDNILTYNKNSYRSKYLLYMIILFFIENIISYTKTLILQKIKLKVSFEINYEILEVVKKFPYKYFVKNNIVALNEKIYWDSINITGFFLDNISDLILKIFTLIFTIIMIIKLDFSMALVAGSFIPVIIILFMYFKKRIYNTTITLKETQNHYMYHLLSQLQNIKYIKIHSLFERFSQDLQKAYEELYLVSLRYFKCMISFTTSDLLLNRFSSLVIVAFCGYKVINKELSIGNFTAMLTYASSLLEIFRYMLNFGRFYEDYKVSYYRMKDVINNDQELNGDLLLNNINYIDIKNLSWENDNCEVIFKNIDITFKKGKIYCLKGRNGSGKTSFINILIGLIQNYSGQIYYNNIDIKKIDLYSLRYNCISIVEQENFLLFNDVIKNISIGLNEIDYEKLSLYCKEFNINELTSTNHNVEKQSFQNSINLSGGEKQKIRIVRQLLKKSDLLILDEPTSALDDNSKSRLVEILQSVKNDRIIMLITHDEYLINNSDEILCF